MYKSELSISVQLLTKLPIQKKGLREGYAVQLSLEECLLDQTIHACMQTSKEVSSVRVGFSLF